MLLPLTELYWVGYIFWHPTASTKIKVLQLSSNGSHTAYQTQVLQSEYEKWK
jgi:hypothetical protein